MIVLLLVPSKISSFLQIIIIPVTFLIKHIIITINNSILFIYKFSFFTSFLFIFISSNNIYTLSLPYLIYNSVLCVQLPIIFLGLYYYLFQLGCVSSINETKLIISILFLLLLFLLLLCI